MKIGNLGLLNSREVEPNARINEMARARVASWRAAMSDKQREEINRKRREAYHAKTPTEKSARSERRREQNKTPSQVDGKRAYKKRMKAFHSNNLHPESMAMENPHFSPELIHPTRDASTLSPQDWAIPDVNGTLVYIQSIAEHCMDVETPSAGHITHRHSVTPGERPALLARRNQKFQTTSTKRPNVSVEEDINGPQTLTQSTIINNGNTLSSLVLL